jgi:hypothetical protein
MEAFASMNHDMEGTRNSYVRNSGGGGFRTCNARLALHERWWRALKRLPQSMSACYPLVGPKDIHQILNQSQRLELRVTRRLGFNSLERLEILCSTPID